MKMSAFLSIKQGRSKETSLEEVPVTNVRLSTVEEVALRNKRVKGREIFSRQEHVPRGLIFLGRYSGID